MKPGSDYDSLYQSALCRTKADWLIGINATRLFSVLYRKTLTVGRVQTPTLKMLVDRETAISAFKKEKYYVVHIKSNGIDAVSERIQDPAEAEKMRTDTQRLVRDYSGVSSDGQKLFQAERVVIGVCPRCGEPVYESKKNYYCSNRDCQFVMWKNDRFFQERKKKFTPRIAAALLKDGKGENQRV